MLITLNKGNSSNDTYPSATIKFDDIVDITDGKYTGHESYVRTKHRTYLVEGTPDKVRELIGEQLK